MDYKVTHHVYSTPEEIEEAKRGLDEYKAENPQWAPMPLVLQMDNTYTVDDRAALNVELLALGITKEKVISIEVLRDDSMDLVRDTELITLANKQPTCAHYDWTTDEVLAFARDVIKLHEERLTSR